MNELLTPDPQTAFTPPGDVVWRDYFLRQSENITKLISSSQSAGANLAPCKVALLPIAPQGTRGFVTDANTTIILGLGSTVVGGGTNEVPVYRTSTAWKIG